MHRYALTHSGNEDVDACTINPPAVNRRVVELEWTGRAEDAEKPVQSILGQSEAAPCPFVIYASS